MIDFNIIKLFFYFIIFFVIILLILEWISRSLLIVKKSEINGKKLNIFGFLMEIDNITILALSVISIKFIFIVFSLIYCYKITLLHLFILLLLSFLYSFFSRSIRNLFFEIISSLAVYFGLFCNSLLYNYMIEVRIIWYIILGMILLSLFMISYSTLFYLRTINNLILKTKYVRGDRNEK